MLDTSVTVLSIAAALYMIVRTYVGEFFEILPIGVAGAPLYVVWAGAIAFGLRARRDQRVPSVVTRIGLVLVALPLLGAAASRGLISYKDQRAMDHWPPRFSDNRFPMIDSLSSIKQAQWASRVAQHALLTKGLDGGHTGAKTITVPQAWPMPSNVTVALREHGDTVEVWARASDGTVACVAQPTAHEHVECTTTDGPAASEYRSVERSPVSAPFSPLATEAESAHGPWPEYRFDAAHAMTDDPHRFDTSGTEWTAHMDGTARSSVSIADDLVLIGAHGTGSVEAFDHETGVRQWRTRVPSWVHMDITSDGRTAAVGFGDNMASFTGSAPSGVSLFDVQTGHLRWTRFDESSVMSGAVFHKDAVVYATALGVVRKVSIASGAVIAEDTLPGGVIMAPAAIVGDTIVYGLEHDHACAILATTLKTLWCRQFPGMRMMGHAAPAIFDGMVVLTASQTIGTINWGEFTDLPLRREAQLVYASLFPNAYYEMAGQRVMALRLHDGSTIWENRNVGKVRNVDGHVAGTASMTDSAGVIVLPQADVVVGFEPHSGHVRWSTGAHLARGPALITHGQAIVAGTDGITEVRDVLTGKLTCKMTRPVGHDRARPALYDGRLYFVDRAGMIESIALDRLLACRGTGFTRS